MRLLNVVLIVIISSVAAAVDWRNIDQGKLIYAHGYCDQPYVVVAEDGTWICLFTTNSGHEGQSSQFIACATSKDHGENWSAPVAIEPPDGPEASWAIPYLSPYGRVYAFYTYNGDDVRTLPDGKKMRADTHGWYCFRYSDDQGKSWSERHRLPMRVTDCDTGNDFGGTVQMFWGIDKPVEAGESVYFAITKLGRYFLENGEGWVYRSDNLKTERDPAKLDWQLLPDGEKGIRLPEYGSTQEEFNIVPLSNGDLYCVYRTTLGHAVECYSRDGGHSWSTPQILRYADGRVLKHPRACPRVWRCQNGKYLFWNHNHGGKGFADRNPVWLSGGIEKDGKIEWSQSEILFYGADHSYNTGRYSYPDIIEVGEKRWITLTQKTRATVHAVDNSLLNRLWDQPHRKSVTANAALLQSGPGMKAIPELKALNRGGSGFTLELGFTLPQEKADTVLLDTTDVVGKGIRVTLLANHRLRMQLNDGQRICAWDSDVVPAGDGAHHAMIIVDGGPDLILFVVDGILSDGASDRQYGWGRFSDELGDINAVPMATLHAPASHFRLYTRPIRVSEAIGNYRAYAE